MKEKILKLINDGKTPTEIKKELGCSRSTIYLHLNKDEQGKANIRRKRFLEKNPDWEKEHHKKHKIRRNLRGRIRAFQRKNNQGNSTFQLKDVLNKFGQNTFCYLTGQKIDLLKDNYELDHIIPFSRGGDNSLNNLGITIPKANRMKCDLMIDELLELCQLIIKNIKNEYVV